MRALHYLVLLLCLAAFVVAAAPSRAQEAGQTLTWSGEYRGRPLTVVLVTKGHTVSEEIQRSEPWWRWGNTSSDTYFFVLTEDQGIDLVVAFSTENAKPKATLYAPTNQEQRLGIRIGSGEYSIPDILPPTLLMWPRQGDWLIDGQFNVQIDSLERDITNGELTWKTSIGGQEPGKPQWYTRTRIYDPAPNDGYQRFGAGVQEDAGVEYTLAESLMPAWPYLSVGVPDDFGHWDTRLRPVMFDPVGRTISQKWVGFHTAGMYQINSLAYAPNTDFEAPFAFYRFDPAAGQYANMVVRSDVWPEGDRAGPPPYHLQRTAVRMTWTGRDYKLWRYSLTAAGNHAMDDQVTIGDAVIKAVPYAQYPAWITSKEWKGVTFVEATGGETGSEGIYDFSVEDNWDVVEWLNGRRAAPPDHYSAPYTDFPKVDPKRLKTGFRGEYSLGYNRMPRLYGSLIDNRVHLMNAEGGLWNLGHNQVLRTHNLDDGPYINGWTRERIVPTPRSSATPARAIVGKVQESLFQLSGMLIYSGAGRAELVLPVAQAENRELFVPTDRASWERYVEQAATFAGQHRDPHDLAGWLGGVAGERTAIRGASITGVRPIRDGFRFVLTLRPGFQVLEPELLTVAGLKPGQYAVSYDGQFSLTPLTPADPDVRLVPPSLTEVETGAIGVVLRNNGLADLASADLELWATAPDGEATKAVTQTVDLLAQTPVSTTLQWAPPVSGEWVLTAKLRADDGAITTFESIRVTVEPSAWSSLTEAVAHSAPPIWLPVSVLSLLALSGVAFVIVRKDVPVYHAEAGDDTG